LPDVDIAPGAVLAVVAPMQPDLQTFAFATNRSAGMTYIGMLTAIFCITEKFFGLFHTTSFADSIVSLLPRLDILAIYRRHLITIQRIREDY